MQSQLTYNPVQSFLFRYRPAFVLLMGFVGAFLLGLLLWELTSATLAVAPPADMSLGGDDARAAADQAATPPTPPEPVHEVVPAASPTGISPVFTAEVRHWEPQIIAWAAEFDLDPDLVATLMQIESCGNPQAVSSVGAQGLFQVMPFHFEAGEQMLDPATNARRGLAYMVNSLSLTEGHVGMALAGYNGGHVAAQGSWESWALETRRYYRWGSGIYNDVKSGLTDSPTLHDWLAAGGSSLCQQAAGRLSSLGGG
jgi:soluble lytic murein transglycosylase-like protein